MRTAASVSSTRVSARRPSSIDVRQETLMQFPRYEFVIPLEHGRCSTPRHLPPRGEPRRARSSAAWCRAIVRRLTARREPRPLLAIHEYLELEFTVEERR
jgi:hypothetical protein